MCVWQEREKANIMEFSSSCDVDDVGDFLLEKGVPLDIVSKFTGKLFASISCL